MADYGTQWDGRPHLTTALAHLELARHPCTLNSFQGGGE